MREAHRGGRQGRGLVAKRFNALSRGDWGTLVDLWEKDKRAAKMKTDQPRQQREKSDRSEQQSIKAERELEATERRCFTRLWWPKARVLGGAG